MHYPFSKTSPISRPTHYRLIMTVMRSTSKLSQLNILEETFDISSHVCEPINVLRSSAGNLYTV